METLLKNSTIEQLKEYYYDEREEIINVILKLNKCS